MEIRDYRRARRSIKAAGGIGTALMKLGTKAVTKAKAAVPLARAIPGVGTALAAVSLASSAGTAAASALKIKTPAGATVRPLAAMPGGVPLYTAPRKKYRRMNAGNGKALNRAIRRVQAAEKLFRKVLSVQGKSHTGIKPKKKGR